MVGSGPNEPGVGSFRTRMCASILRVPCAALDCVDNTKRTTVPSKSTTHAEVIGNEYPDQLFTVDFTVISASRAP